MEVRLYMERTYAQSKVSNIRLEHEAALRSQKAFERQIHKQLLLMTHEQLIAACTQWFWNTFPEERRMLYAVNNNVSAGLSKHQQIIEGNKNKAKGVVAGVLDLCYLLPNKCCYLDAKVGNDRLSDDQLDFIGKLEDRNHLWCVFKSLEEFKEIIYRLQNTYMI